MDDTRIETIEEEILRCAVDGESAAVNLYSHLYLARKEWDRLQSADSRNNLVREARTAENWLRQQS